MRKFDTIIFDLDGTLLYTLDDLTDSINYVLTRRNMPLRTIAEIQTFVGNGLDRLMELALPQGRTPDFEEIFNEFKAHYATNCNNKTRLYDGVREMLQALQDYKLAIVTNKNVTALQVLQHIYFDGLIDVVIGQTEGIAKKPAPDSVYLALDKLGSAKESSLYIGDSEVDILTARNSGLTMITATWGFRSREYLESKGGYNFADTPSDLLRIINGLNR